MPFWRRTARDNAGDRPLSRGWRRRTDPAAEVDAALLAMTGRSREPLSVGRWTGSAPRSITPERLAATLHRLEVYHLTDPDGSAVGMWERHAVRFALEGPDCDILMVRARANAMVLPDGADRAYQAMNTWNHDRRFLKAYVGEPTELGRLPLYAEMQIPLVPGVHDHLLDELVGCAVDVAESWAEWLHADGAVL